MKRLVIFSTIVLSLIALSASSASACSCVSPDANMTVKQQVATALKSRGAVFSAKVIAVKVDDNEHQQVTYTIQVLRVWKGKVPKTTTISTGSNSAMCGYSFSEGETYLIYGSGSAVDGFHTTHCTRTTRLRESEDLRYLGKGRKPARKV